MQGWERITKEVLRFLLPWACAGCRAAMRCLDDDGFCGRCWLRIKRIDGTICERCGAPLIDGGATCYSCREMPNGLLIRAAVTFSGPLRPAIHRFKYGGRPSLVRSFGVLLDWAWARYPQIHKTDLILPVPVYRSTLRKRGYNQAALLAHALAQGANRLFCEPLVRTKRTKPQFALNREERQANLFGAFSIPNPVVIKGKTALLIDDICTTGSTLKECSRVLRKAGARQVMALVLAREV